MILSQVLHWAYTCVSLLEKLTNDCRDSGVDMLLPMDTFVSDGMVWPSADSPGSAGGVAVPSSKTDKTTWLTSESRRSTKNGFTDCEEQRHSKSCM